jgi:hypothetical protein
MSQRTGIEHVRVLLIHKSALKLVLQENKGWAVPWARIDLSILNGDPTTAAYACLREWFGASEGVVDLRQSFVSQTGNYLFSAHIDERNHRAVALFASSSKGIATGWFMDEAIDKISHQMATHTLSKHRGLVSQLLKVPPRP